ncbi:MAG: hypothetical protein ACLQUY_01315 [Ktedonobacterales bacterium]
MDDELLLWFEHEGMLRYRVESDEMGKVSEETRPPAIALGPRDEDWVWTPHPGRQQYPWKSLEHMTLDDFNNYLYRWFEEAVRHGVVRCAHCGKLLIDGDDLPDADTWDAILVEKELVGWLAVHFDCKKQLPKRLKGLHPFELEPKLPPLYDLSHVPMPTSPSEAAGP